MVFTIIGIGLIGGSFAIDFRTKGLANRIIGVEKNKINAQRALELGIVDEISDLEKAVKIADVVIISTPVDVSERIITKVLDFVDKQLVFDVGSTKQSIIKNSCGHPKRGNFVAAHPMAGTEFSGPDAAKANLFTNKTMIICNKNSSAEWALRKAIALFEALDMNITYMDAKNHDIHAAYVSHISHISSFALALSVLYKEKDEKKIFEMAAGGFESTVRLAKSSSEMWTPIFLQNKKNLLEVLDTYINFLYDFKLAIFNDDAARLNDLMKRGNKIKNILNNQIVSQEGS